MGCVASHFPRTQLPTMTCFHTIIHRPRSFCPQECTWLGAYIIFGTVNAMILQKHRCKLSIVGCFHTMAMGLAWQGRAASVIVFKWWKEVGKLLHQRNRELWRRKRSPIWDLHNLNRKWKASHQIQFCLNIWHDFPKWKSPLSTLTILHLIRSSEVELAVLTSGHVYHLYPCVKHIYLFYQRDLHF